MSLFNKKEEGEKLVLEKEVINENFSFNYGLDLVPVFTEKSHSVNSIEKYVFKSSKKLKKSEVKLLVEKVYNVDVIKVNSSVISKKKRTIKYNRGYQKPYKKTIVTLKKGQSITDFQKV